MTFGSPDDARPGRAEAGVRTFLIADVRGYTRFTDERGDEAAARLARRFADLAAEGVSANGGEVVELRGDEVLAMFVSARAALHAAVELQVVFRAESSEDRDVPLEVGIGLDAGEAVPVGDGFRGGALNLAARLCGQAGSGEVIASQGVVHLARAIDGIRYDPLEPLILKGLAEPVQAFRVRSVDDDPPIQRPPVDPGRRSDDPGELPSELDPVDPLFVGRTADLGWLHWSWRLAGLRGGRVVVLIGPDGMGKTRLAAELATRLHRDGARIAYAPANGSSNVLERAMTIATAVDRPSLVVVDDLDQAPPQVVERLAAVRAGIATRPILVVATVGGDAADPRIGEILERLDPAGDRRRRLRPLDEAAVHEIAALYASVGSGSLPAGAILATTGGVPLEVHRATSAWATLEASRRLEVWADRTSTGRSDLRTVEAELAGDIVDLQLARERARLIDPDAAVGGDPDASAAVCPFKGLAPFETADADYFFGRERLVAELIARLVGTSLLGVIGPSGSGKSSAVRAGLLPGLASGVLPGSERWRQVVMRPGEDPAKELERALAGEFGADGSTADGPGAAIDHVVRGMAPGERLLLVVDQFEETFTTVADETDRVAFIDALTTAATSSDGRVVVVVAVRADLYGRCSAYPRLSRALAASQVLVGLLGRDELRRAIELPARRAGLRVEPDLVDALVDEVIDEPGGLPLLSTTLLELWQLRDGRTLRMASFERIGGVRGSVARLAEAAYQRLTPDQRSLARSSLLRLAGPGEGDAVVRRRAPLAEFDVDRNPDAAEVLRVLTDSRLITTSQGTVEVAHEALLREWPRLVGWLEEDAQGHQVHRHLIEASKGWASSGRDPAELYRGARLASALEWTTDHPLDLNELEREFVTESRAASEREIDRQRRTNRRLRFLLVGAVGLLVVALAAGGFAVVQTGQAQRAATAAETQRIAAESQRLGAQALVDTQLDRSLLLAREGVNLDDTATSRSNLLAALLRSPAAIGIGHGDGNRLLSLAIRPDGSLLVAGDNHGSLFFLDPQTLKPVGEPMHLPTGDPSGAQPGAVAELQFSPDGRSLAARGDGRHGDWVAIVDPSARQLRAEIVVEAVGRTIADMTFTTDGSEILTVENEGSGFSVAGAVVVRDASTGRPTRTVVSGLPQLAALAVIPGSTRFGLSTAPGIGNDQGTWIYDLDSGSRVGDFKSLGSAHLAAAPDGRNLLGAESVLADGSDSAVVVNNLEFVQSDWQGASGHGGAVTGMTWAPKGNAFVTTSDDRTVIVRDIAGQLLERLTGHAGSVSSPVFSPDGGTLYTCSLDGTVIAWDLGRDRRLARPFVGSQGQGAEPVRGTVFDPLAGVTGNSGGSIVATVSPDGQWYVASDADKLLRRWDATKLKASLTSMTGRTRAATSAFYSPDGTRLYSTGPDGVLAYDMVEPDRAGNPIGPPLVGGPEDGTFGPGAIGPDGRTVVVGTGLGRILVWNVASGTRAATIVSQGAVQDLALSPDGASVVGAFDDGHLRSFDVANGRPIWDVTGADVDPVFAVRISPDGTALAAGDSGGRVTLYAAATGAQVSRPLPGPRGLVDSLAFSPDGTLLAAGGADGTATLYDVATQRQIGTALTSQAQGRIAVAFTPDGRSLVAAAANGHHLLWDVDPARWRSQACEVAGRQLTQDEWTAALPDRPYANVCP